MLFKKLIRTAGRYKAQFISMIIMTALGIAMFLGFNMEWMSLEKDFTTFFENTGFADYRVISEEGFTREDLEKISQIDGVDKACRYLSVNVELQGSGKLLGVTVTEDPEISGFVVMEGSEYDPASEDGMWLFDRFAQGNDISVGDELELQYESISIRGKVMGLIESSEYMIPVQDETQMMPDFNTYGYVYITPVMLENAVADAVREGIIDSAKSLLGNKYTDEYGETMIGNMFDSYYEKAVSAIYPQINVLSDLDKAAFKDAVNEVMGKTMVVVSRDETISYAEAKGECQEGKTMGLILPVLFLLISVLTMVTTMHRIASNEKTQIGTLKALGFKDKRILRHYSAYTLMIGILGSLLGIALGYFIAWFILNPDGSMGTYIVMPEWKLYIPWWCWIVIAAVIVLMLVIGRISVKKMMQGTAADALRPYVPKVSGTMLIERTSLWEKMKFGTKWNLRDIMRHKSRSIVTLVGIIGCMVLMVSAIGMYETLDAFIRISYTENAVYESRIYIADSASEEDALALAEEYEGDYSASLSVQAEEETYSLDIYHLENELIHFNDRSNHKIGLPDDGALACLRLQDKYGLKEGDEISISLFGTDDTYTIRIAGFDRSLTEGFIMSDTYASTLSCDGAALTDHEFCRINSVYTRTEKADIAQDPAISTIQSKADIEASMDKFMDIMYLAVAILAIAAIVLGIVVLYNLGVMSYTERYREMATLKVVGFKNHRIRKLLLQQNVWLTVIGIILGMFAGIGVLNYLMAALAPEYELSIVIGPLTIIISVAVTFGVSLLVGLLVARKSKNVNMVEALKMPE